MFDLNLPTQLLKKFLRGGISNFLEEIHYNNKVGISPQLAAKLSTKYVPTGEIP